MTRRSVAPHCEMDFGRPGEKNLCMMHCRTMGARQMLDRGVMAVMTWQSGHMLKTMRGPCIL